MTPTVELEPNVYADLILLSQAWGLNHSDTVERLIETFRSNPSPGPPPARSVARASDDDWIAVFADYNGVRVTGEYDPRSHAVRITSGIGNRRTFKSPSGAAIAVVSELNPKVDPNRNGWSFWNVRDTGTTLQHIRHD